MTLRLSVSTDGGRELMRDAGEDRFVGLVDVDALDGAADGVVEDEDL